MNEIPNQYRFEIVRDIARLLGKIPPGEKITINIRRHQSGVDPMYDWECSDKVEIGAWYTANALQITWESLEKDK